MTVTKGGVKKKRRIFPKIGEGMRRCAYCLEVKLLGTENFYRDSGKYYGGFSYRCIQCESKRDAQKHRKSYFMEYMRKNLKTSPHKWEARRLARLHVKKQPCITCGSEKSEAHHPDYSKPLDVVWLCHKHHFAVHHPIEPEVGDNTQY